MIRATTALSIAESDPSGELGVQADLRTFGALGAYGTAVLTTLTAHGRNGVVETYPVPADFVERQLRALDDDVQIDAIRIGMLATAEVADAVAAFLTDHPYDVVVLDPLLAWPDGRGCVGDDTVAALRRLMRVTALITPNRAEAGRLLGVAPAGDVGQMFDQARRLRDAGAQRVLLKGGHLGGDDAVDVLVGPDGEDMIGAPWVDGTGERCLSCGLSAAIAVIRAQGGPWRTSVAEAKQWVSATIRARQPLSSAPTRAPVHRPGVRHSTVVPAQAKAPV